MAFVISCEEIKEVVEAIDVVEVMEVVGEMGVERGYWRGACGDEEEERYSESISDCSLERCFSSCRDNFNSFFNFLVYYLFSLVFGFPVPALVSILVSPW